MAKDVRTDSVRFSEHLIIIEIWYVRKLGLLVLAK